MLAKALAVLAAFGTASQVLAADPYPITGAPIPQGTTGAPLRMNINDLQAQGGPQWDLYIRALSEMQGVDYRDTLSYFQISGIHGKPYIEWNGTGAAAYDNWGGYCPHGEELFLSWHRPYVLLFEQVLVSHARRIAQTYPTRYRQQYVRAAETLRSPYWDWAADSRVPASIAPAKVSVNFPNGQNLQKRQINNPLSTYTIPQPVLKGEYGEFDSDNRPHILHCPAPDNYPATANANLAGSPYRQWVYDAFTRATNFSDFATQSNRIVSLEIIHNSIHWDAACGQQFVMPDLSGFDPLFMLHHTNIDRLYSYWQALRPQFDIFSGSYAGGSRFTTPSGTIITPQTPLMPFFARGGRALTTEAVRSIRNFGYSYAGLEYWSNFDRAHVPKPSQIQVLVRGQRAASFVVAAFPAAGALSAGLPLDSITEASDVKVMSTTATAELLQSDLSIKVIKLDGTTVEKVESLAVKLEEVQVTPPKTQTDFPKYGESKLRTINAAAALQAGARKGGDS
ncbi:hypothetical protein HIM_07253 [Hirsutella minnesotensis 3608]|uniref:tyrosinase n=1 Tax=Hirsutella minnesotensis 3608 TaxID=1043627 RepID=A0A0F8A4E9_9HYPO|nr:hypothetical protein HIM_07253 [Hirsutella minnesotensis 3608]